MSEEWFAMTGQLGDWQASQDPQKVVDHAMSMLNELEATLGDMSYETSRGQWNLGKMHKRQLETLRMSIQWWNLGRQAEKLVEKAERYLEGLRGADTDVHLSPEVQDDD